mgnify:CR=1 FL=1
MWNETNKEIARRLKDRREALGYSFQQLAELTGMSKSTLQRYESGAIKNIPHGPAGNLDHRLANHPEQLAGLADGTGHAGRPRKERFAR